MPLTLHVPQNPKPLPPGFQTIRHFVTDWHQQNHVNSLYNLCIGSAIKSEENPELSNWAYIQSPFKMGAESRKEPDLAVEIALGGRECLRKNLFAALLHEGKPDQKRWKKKRGNPLARPPTKMINLRGARDAAVRQLRDRMGDPAHWKKLRKQDWTDLIGSVGIGEHCFVCVRKTGDGLTYRVAQEDGAAEFQEHLITRLPGRRYTYPAEQFTSIDLPFFQNVYSAAGEHILRQVLEKQQEMAAQE